MNNSRGFLIKQGADYDRVHGVLTRLLEVASPDVSTYKFEVVLRDRAYLPLMECLPNGKISIDTGILDKLESDDELALLLGHEIAHAVAMHGLETSLRSVVGATIEGLMLWRGLRLSPLSEFVLQGAKPLWTHLYVNLHYSRKQELEADLIGLVYAFQAGYNVTEAIPVWARLRQHLTTAWEPRSTHPSPWKRESLLRRLVEEVEETGPYSARFSAPGATIVPRLYSARTEASEHAPQSFAASVDGLMRELVEKVKSAIVALGSRDDETI